LHDSKRITHVPQFLYLNLRWLFRETSDLLGPSRNIVPLGKQIPFSTCPINQESRGNHLGDGPVVKIWNQEVYSLCGLRFEPCGCSYDGHWRLIWSLTSWPVGLVEVRTS